MAKTQSDMDRLLSLVPPANPPKRTDDELARLRELVPPANPLPSPAPATAARGGDPASLPAPDAAEPQTVDAFAARHGPPAPALSSDTIETPEAARAALAPARPMIGAAPEPEPSDLLSGFKAGMGNAVAGIGSAIAGDAREHEMGFLAMVGDAIANYGKGVAQANAPKVADVREVKSLGDALDWAAWNIGQGGASTVPIILSSVAGGLVGGPAGAAAGALAPSYDLMQGQLRAALLEEGVDEETAQSYSQVAAVPMAMLESALPGEIGGRLLGQGAARVAARGLLRRVAAGGAGGVLKEGATEGAQEAIQIATEGVATGDPVLTLESAARILNATAAGGVGGGPLGAAGGLVPDQVDAAAPSPTPLPVEVEEAVAKAAERVGDAVVEDPPEIPAPLSVVPPVPAIVPQEATVVPPPDPIVSPPPAPEPVSAFLPSNEVENPAQAPPPPTPPTPAPPAIDPSQPERVLAAAITTKDGRVFTGAVHMLATEAAQEAGAFGDQPPGVAGYRSGFYTSHGRFIDRHEALAVARSSQQPNIRSAPKDPEEDEFGAAVQQEDGLDALDIRDRHLTEKREVTPAPPPPARPTQPAEAVEAEEAPEPSRSLDPDDVDYGTTSPEAAPVLAKSPEDQSYEYREPGRRKVMFARELEKAKKLDDAPLLDAYKQKLRSAARLEADATGNGGSFVRANRTSAEARFEAYRQVIEARRLPLPSSIDAWRDIPAAEQQERFHLLNALEEAEALDDDALLDELDVAREAATSDPGSRAKMERAYALAATAKDRGLIGGSMFEEDLATLYSRPAGALDEDIDEDDGPVDELDAAPGRAPRRPLEPRDIRRARRAHAAKVASRIQPDPIPGGDPKKLSDIIVDLSTGLGRRVRKAKPHRAGVIGTYFPGSARTVIRYAGDLDTTAHEVAHALDDEFGIVGAWAGKRKRSPFDAELIPAFSQHGSATTSGPRARLSYKRAEGVAEWVRAWIVNPGVAEQAAPQFAAHFRSVVPAATLKKLQDFSDDVRTFAGLDEHTRTKANVETKPRDRKGRYLSDVRAKLKGEGYEVTGLTSLDRLNAKLFDSLAPVMLGIDAARRLRGVGALNPSKDPRILIRLFGGINDKVEDIFAHGMVNGRNQRVTDGGIDWLMSWVDSTSRETIERDLEDVGALMVNERVIEKARIMDAELDAAIRTLHDRVRLGQLLKKAAAGMKAKGAVDAKLLGDIDALKEKIADGPADARGGAINRTQFSIKATRLREAVRLRQSRLSGAGGGLFSDTEQAKAAVRVVTADAERYQRLQEGAKRYRKWADSVLKYMVAKGRMSAEQYREIKASNLYYVAMHRVATEIDPEAFPGSPKGGGRRLGSAAKVAARWKGSTKEIGNPYINLLQQTHVMVREADRNEAIRTFTDLLRADRGMYQGKPVDFDALGSLAEPGDTNAISVYVDGKEEKWQFEQGIHEALKNWNDVDTPSEVELLARLPGKIMRYFVTHSPDFLVRNVIRDATHRAIMSRTGGKPWDVLHVLNPSEVQAMKLFGGGQAGWYRQERIAYYDELQKQMKLLAKEQGTILAAPVMMKNAWERMSQGSELVGRMAEYRSALKKAKTELGYSDYDAQLYAAYQARDLIDYAVAGTIVRRINKYVPFTNPRIQGLRRTVRAAKENPALLFKLFVLYGLVPTLIAYAVAAVGGEDEEEEYLQQPAYLRDFFFNFKVGPDLWLRIPKSFEAGVLASGVERALSAARGHEGSFDSYFKNLLHSFAPLDEDAVAGPARIAVELMANYDFFRERHIVSPFEEDRALELRKGQRYASRLGQVLGKVLHVDARNVDHVIKSEFGGLGRVALRVGDIGTEGSARTGGPLVDTGLFVNSPGPQSRDAVYVLQRAKELGMENDGQIKAFRRKIDAYYDAPTGTRKDAAARAIRIQAKRLRKQLEHRQP